MKKILFLFVAAFLFSCQTSKITHSWKVQNISPKKYNNILVLGVLKDNDQELQVKMENHLAGDLKKLGYNTVAANEVFSPGTFVKGDTARALAAINSRNFDAIITIVLLNEVKEKYYVPGRLSFTPYSMYYDRFDRYYYTMYDRIYTEGYYTTETKIFWESNFYDLMDKRMIYSAQTRSFHPGSRESLAHYYGVLITNNLLKNNILLKQDELRSF